MDMLSRDIRERTEPHAADQQLPLPRLMISGLDPYSGQNLVFQAVLGAWIRRKVPMQTWIAGSDHTQAGLHRHMTGRDARFLDSWLLDGVTLGYLLQRNAGNGILSLVQAPNGLYDGWIEDPLQLPEGCPAELAAMLDIPVVLVIDGSSLTYAVIPQLLGIKRLAGDNRLAGVIFCFCDAVQHDRWAPILEAATGLPSFGYLFVPKDSREHPIHLVTPPGENWAMATGDWVSAFNQQLSRFSTLAAETIGLDELLACGQAAPKLAVRPPSGFMQLMRTLSGQQPFRLGVARDAAFHIYDPDNLDLLRDMGADPVFFSPLRHSSLPPDLDGLYFGGGHPELVARELSENTGMRRQIREKAAAGLPILAEGEGIFYFAHRLESAARDLYPMLELIPGDGLIQRRRTAARYCEMTAIHSGLLCGYGEQVRACWPDRLRLTAQGQAFRIKCRGMEITRDVFMSDTICCTPAGIRFYSAISMARRFASACAARAAERLQNGTAIRCWDL